jgi:hypothetical protein
MSSIIFKAHGYESNNIQKNNTWQLTYNIFNVEGVPENLLKFIKTEYPFPMPLSYWALHLQDFQKNIPDYYEDVIKLDFFDDYDNATLEITLSKYIPIVDSYIVDVDLFLASDILKQMNLPLEGKMHPEKFEIKLSSTILITESLFGTNQKVVETLLRLEDLSAACLEEEYLIQWFKVN